MDVRVEAECPDVVAEEQSQAKEEDQDEQHKEQQPQVQPATQEDEQPGPADQVGGEGQQSELQSPQQQDEQPQKELPQDPPNAANVGATPDAARVTARTSDGKVWRRPGVLVAGAVAGLLLLVGGAAIAYTATIVTQEDNSSELKTAEVSEEKVVKYRCDTLPTYDADDASTCGGGNSPDNACFTLHKGANWQCFGMGYPTMESPMPCDEILLDGKEKFYKGACVFKSNAGYQDAMDAHNLKLADEEAKAPDAIEKETREKEEEKHEEPTVEKETREKEVEKHEEPTVEKDTREKKVEKREEPTLEKETREKEDKQEKPRKGRNSRGVEEEKHEEPMQNLDVVEKDTPEKEEEKHEEPISSLRNLKWRWAEHKVPGMQYYVPRAGIRDSWNMPADRDALVIELKMKMEDPKAAAKQYETRSVEFADVDYPERRRTFADFTKALDWLKLASNIQSREEL